MKLLLLLLLLLRLIVVSKVVTRHLQMHLRRWTLVVLLTKEILVLLRDLLWIADYIHRWLLLLLYWRWHLLGDIWLRTILLRLTP